MSEDRAPDPPIWKAAIQSVSAIGGAVMIGFLAPLYGASWVPPAFPAAVYCAAAVLGLVVAWYVILWLLWLPEKLAEPFLTLWERIPSFARHEVALISVAFCAVIAAPIIASQYRPHEPTALQRAIMARPALPAPPAPPTPRLAAVAVMPPEVSVKPLLAHLRGLRKPIQRQRKRRAR
jgi:hypothetical protein